MTIKNEEIVTGIVLKNKPYRENDLLVWIYTHDYGKLTFLAKGVKKMTSKNAPACQTITLADYNLILKPGISSLIKGNSQVYFRHIKQDIELEAYATYCLEFVDKFTDENEPQEEIYDTLLAALMALENGYQPKLVYLLFNAFILKMTGSALEVDQCVNCNRQDLITGISVVNGGFVCQNCQGKFDFQEPVAILKGFRYINKWDILKIDQLHLDDDVIDRLVKIMDIFIDEYSGIRFNSRKFIQQLNKL
ncbi:DNA repair protein RecO [uncultured Thomasclavelia sp.]|uniref:DNA repair protein RecO n=1 Tax=uncultured Thomasclavelia sp. TaxID=3025759 RepID=UPI0025F9EEB5|nr:DNA repair protein RecO [uncultured Thomasclavelia sp.]